MIHAEKCKKIEEAPKKEGVAAELAEEVKSLADQRLFFTVDTNCKVRIDDRIVARGLCSSKSGQKSLGSLTHSA
jgi:hypothetical protein